MFSEEVRRSLPPRRCKTTGRAATEERGLLHAERVTCGRSAKERSPMAYVFAFLKQQSFVLMFLVIGAGFVLARIKIFSISLGVVAWTLIFGLLLSLWAVQSANISFALPPFLQSTFFDLYIFCVGLRVGPQCFAGLERNGKKFVGVAVVTLVVTAVLALLCGWFFRLDAGTLAGVVAGSNTASASFGAAESAAQSGAAGPNGEALAVNLSV